MRRVALVAVLWAAMPQIAFAQLAADGTEFVLTIGDGRVLRSPDLVGATLMIGEGGDQVAVTIVSVEEDPHAVGGRVFLHHFLVTEADGGKRDFCTPDAEGRSLGFPAPAGEGGFDLTCTSGAIGKCIRWGYRPWEQTPGEAPLRALHKACVYMTRADYGGDGGTNTRDGTLVHVCDRFGIRPCIEGAPMQFEAAWGERGATCVARTRIPALATLENLAERYPELAPHLGPDACSEETALRDPAALLFNRSQ